MNIIVVYATNTGNTYLAAQIIQDILSQNYPVDLINASDTNSQTLSKYDLVILGSSSWDWQGKEGHPLHSMIDLLKSCPPDQFTHKKFACFGCGDQDFRLFCGAVDHLEEFVTQASANLVIHSLKIDKFHIDILHKIDLTKAWAKDLSSKL